MITGAGGDVAARLIPGLSDGFELRLIDIRPGERIDHCIDICDTTALVGALDGVDAIVHLAGERQVSASWEELRGPNVDGLVSVFEAARQAGVPKVVFASTNHVMGMYDRDHEWPVDPAQPVRPDSLYGATKAFGEAAGRYYSDAFGMSVLCLRIGWVLDRPHNEQARMMWLSPGDLTQLVTRCLRSDIAFGIYYAVSANTNRRWSIENAHRDLGYEPADNSEDYFADVSRP
ncbi:MAG TPA: NAD(P)-dependent oxidoreductase [Mycobacteriales bacterium]|nr:NAD(P)-dependent oxidoreductase [Mycobacteriales bacterium]